MTIESVSGVSQTTPVGQSAIPKATGQMESLGQDAFLTLLLAQLKNQDPLKPMDDTEFIAQLAQFNSLNQLTEMNKNMEELKTAQMMTQGSGLIGKTITGLSGGKSITGVVSGVKLTQGNVYLDVDDHQVALDTVHTIEETPVDTTTTTTTEGGQNG